MSNRKYIYLGLIFLILTGFNFSNVAAGNKNQTQENHTKSTDKDSLRIVELCQQSALYFHQLNNKFKADSISELAIEIATSLYKPGLLIKAYSNYIENNDLGFYKKKAIEYAVAAKKLSAEYHIPEWTWQCNLNLSKARMLDYDYEKALVAAYNSLTIAGDLQDESKKAHSFLMIGKSLEGNNEKIDAFKNYLLATKIAREIDNNKLLGQCYSYLSEFYIKVKSVQKAVEYKLLEEEIIAGINPVDSLGLMWIKYDLQVINLNSDVTRYAGSVIRQILNYANRNQSVKLKDYTLSLNRSILIELNRIDLLKQFYTNDYPEEFERLKQKSPSFYYRLKAYFSEVEGNTDLAEQYFTKAGELLSSNANKILRSHFHLRYGEFYKRSGQTQKAIGQLTQAYQLSEEAGYLAYILETSLLLEGLYEEMRNFEKAYWYATNSKQLTDSINQITEKDKLLMLELDHEAHQRALAEEREYQKTLRRHNLQYTAIVIIIVIIFIMLMMLGSFKVPSWLIRALGFVSFIFLFEFIILLADFKIHHLTHGEPWKMMAIKVVLIGFLLPFHHWIEHKVVHFLVNNQLIRFSGSIFGRLFKAKQQDSPEK